jgi:hypothetical protein
MHLQLLSHGSFAIAIDRAIRAVHSCEEDGAGGFLSGKRRAQGALCPDSFPHRPDAGNGGNDPEGHITFIKKR